MEQDILDIAAGCRSTSAMLMQAAEEAETNIGAPDYLHDMLLRLYYAIGLKEKMAECEAALAEDTDMDTVEAVLGASAAVDDAGDRIFTQLEEYAEDDEEFEAEIDALTLSESVADVDDLLKKLYKCEGILRMAYRVSAHIPIYGMVTTDDQGAPEDKGRRIHADAGKPPEDFLKKKLGVDLDALHTIRQELIRLIAVRLKGEGA